MKKGIKMKKKILKGDEASILAELAVARGNNFKGIQNKEEYIAELEGYLSPSALKISKAIRGQKASKADMRAANDFMEWANSLYNRTVPKSVPSVPASIAGPWAEDAILEIYDNLSDLINNLDIEYLDEVPSKFPIAVICGRGGVDILSSKQKKEIKNNLIEFKNNLNNLIDKL